MTVVRLDLRHLRLLLAIVAITLAGLSGIAALPHGARAAGTANAEFNCAWEGGTWTVDGNTGYCKGLGKGKDYKCHLDIGPTACEYLPLRSPNGSTGPIKPGMVVQTGVVEVAPVPEPTKTPKQTRVESASTINEMAPLDE